jgi:hypothetical protein
MVIDPKQFPTWPLIKLTETIQLESFHTIILIHEHSLDACPSSTNSIERIDSLWSCLSAAKSWFSLFFRIDTNPLFRYPQVSMPILNQLAHCMIVLFRLNTFESAGIHWDRTLVRQELDISDMVKLMASRWEEDAMIAALDEGHVDDMFALTHDPEHGPWAYIRKRLLMVAHFWETKLANIVQAEERRIKEIEDSSLTVAGLDQPQIEQMDFSNMDFLNDIWMGDYSGC